MPRLRLGRSCWLDQFPGRARRYPALLGDRRADIAIVGGGITGCAAALLFARAGAAVVLVESARIGRGSTAASTALLMQEPDTDFTKLSERYGPARARRIWSCSRDAVRALRRTLAALDTPTLEALPSVYFTRDPAKVPALKREVAARERAGLAARWLDSAKLRHAAGIDAEGAILTAGNAQVDPYRACLAVARGAAAHGAALFEHSTVRKIDGTRRGVTIKLAGGTITADWAVIATGYATPAFKPLAARFTMMNTYVIATPRIPAAVRRRMGLGDVMMWDTAHPYHYLRWTPDHRLLFGGMDRPQLPRAIRPAALRRRASGLTAELIDLYPSLAGITPEYSWEGLFAMTPDGLPYVGTHRRYPRQLFALGYGGNGMTLGFLAAQSLVRIAQGTANRDDELFGFGRMNGRR
jgi:glycine/D-amino acid oxidase-like deaminating enzyme